MYALAGLESGISGALALLLWLAIGSVLTGHSVWWVPNLVAAVRYGASSLRESAGVYTAMGAALIFLTYGVVGIVYGQLLGERGGGFRQFCFSLIVAMGVDWVVLRWFWTAVNPTGHLYASDTQILFGHLIFGCLLARYPHNLRLLSRVVGRC